MAAKSKGPAIPEGYKRLSGSERPRPSASRYLGPVDASEQISATLILRQKPGSPALPGHEHWDNTPPGHVNFFPRSSTPKPMARLQRTSTP